MIKKIMSMVFLFGIMLSFVSAGSVADFWTSKGLPLPQALEIESGDPSPETVRQAELLQNPPEPKVNQTIISQVIQEEQTEKDLWFLFYAGLFATILFGSIILLGVMFFGWGRGL